MERQFKFKLQTTSKDVAPITTSTTTSMKKSTLEVLMNTTRSDLDVSKGVGDAKDAETLEIKETSSDDADGLWLSFVSLGRVKMYGNKFWNVGAIHDFIKEENIKKFLNEYHDLRKQGLYQEMDGFISKLKKMVRLIEKEGKGNEDQEFERQHMIHNSEYLLRQAFSIKT